MKQIDRTLIVEAVERCLCEKATASLIDVELIGPLTVSLWKFTSDEERYEADGEFGETGYGIKLVKTKGIFCPPGEPLKSRDIVDLNNGLRWATEYLRSFRIREE